MTRTVYVPAPQEEVCTETETSVPESDAVTDAMLLQLFDEIDTDVTGFAARMDLKSRLQPIVEQDSSISGLLKAVEGLEVIVVERDDFKVMLARWRGLLPAEAAEATEEEIPMSDSALLRLFDSLDEESTGFVPKLDLHRTLSTKSEADGSLSTLVELVNGVETSIVNREDFVELLALRHAPPAPEPAPAPAGKGAPAGGKGAPAVADSTGVQLGDKGAPSEGMKPALSPEELMAIFDEVDNEGVGFAPRLDLQHRVEVHEGTADLVEQLRGSEGIIVEKLAFANMVHG